MRSAIAILMMTGCNSILGNGPIRAVDDAATGVDAADLIDAKTIDAAAIDAMTAPIDGRVDAAPPPDANITAGMIAIPAGLFRRGCNAGVEDCTTTSKLDELPSLEITLSGYWIDETEVTQAAYKACVTAAKCTAPAANFDPSGHANYPVSNVTWAQAVAYCTWLGKRLPTEAEWEKAARGTDGRTYPWGNLAPTCQQAYWLNCPGGDAASIPIGGHPSGASPYGMQDIAGNALEWTNDWYGNSYYDVSPSTDPQGPATGTDKVSRGGAWAYGSLYLRTANRYAIAPTTALDQQGVRCAR